MKGRAPLLLLRIAQRNSTREVKTQYRDQALILKGQWVHFKCYCSVEAGNFGINIENAVWDYLKVACRFGEILADIFI